MELEKKIILEQLVQDYAKKLIGINTTILCRFVDVSLPYKPAKLNFKRDLLLSLMQTNYCNVSYMAKILKINRRSIHRYIQKSDYKDIKQRMLKPRHFQIQEIKSVVIKRLNKLGREKQEIIKENISELSEKVAGSLPNLTWKNAEREFDRIYFNNLLKKCKNLKEVARFAKLRYETVARKVSAVFAIVS